MQSANSSPAHDSPGIKVPFQKHPCTLLVSNSYYYTFRVARTLRGRKDELPQIGADPHSATCHLILLPQPSLHPMTNITRVKSYGLSIQACNIPAEPITTSLHTSTVCCVQLFFSSLSNHSPNVIQVFSLTIW